MGILNVTFILLRESDFETGIKFTGSQREPEKIFLGSLLCFLLPHLMKPETTEGFFYMKILNGKHRKIVEKLCPYMMETVSFTDFSTISRVLN